MEIVLALLRTLVFVVATVAATVYVSRRIGRGRPLLWTGTTLLALYWLMLFGWTSYLTGNSSPSADLAIWVGWGGHLLPFFAALAYIWGIGQSAGFPSRTPDKPAPGAGAKAGVTAGKQSERPVPPKQPAAPAPASGGSTVAPVAPGTTATPVSRTTPAAPTSGTDADAGPGTDGR